MQPAGWPDSGFTLYCGKWKKCLIWFCSTFPSIRSEFLSTVLYGFWGYEIFKQTFPSILNPKNCMNMILIEFLNRPSRPNSGRKAYLSYRSAWIGSVCVHITLFHHSMQFKLRNLNPADDKIRAQCDFLLVLVCFGNVCILKERYCELQFSQWT